MVIVLCQTPTPLPQKHSFWDRPGIQLDRAICETSLTSAFQQASYLVATFCHSGDWLFAASEFAASRKTAKYVSLAASYIFFPIAVETQGPLREDARQLLCDVGRRISVSSGNDREVNFLFQRVSVVVQRFNALC